MDHGSNDVASSPGWRFPDINAVEWPRLPDVISLGISMVCQDAESYNSVKGFKKPCSGAM